MTEYHLSAGALTFRYLPAEARLELIDAERHERLLLFPPNTAPLLPAAAERCQPPVVELREQELLFTTHTAAGLRVETKIRSCGDHFALSSSWLPIADYELTELPLFPAGTRLGLYQLVNFRNRHHTDQVWPELPLGFGECRTDTYSGDWQFAPHPTALLLTKNRTQLFVGADSAPVGGYGFYFQCHEYTLDRWILHYGDPGCGLELKAGTAFTTPTFRLFLRRGESAFDAYTAFGRLLVREGLIPDPTAKPRFPWHRDGVYCTWNDQCARTQSLPPADLQAQAALAESEQPFLKVLDEAFVRRAAALIRHERLPLNTILLDDGWQIARGHWEPHPERFPDLRRLVDDLHRDGFRVVVWWNWAEILPEAESSLVPAHLLAGGRRNRHGRLMRDYSKPETQQEYLIPLFRRLFSSEPGCFDLDGVKTDFLADKVHPELPPADPAWRGEENYFRRVSELFLRELRRHKPDGVHIGCAGNYFLAHTIDLNRTYDVANSNPREHGNRARMLRATTPGTPVVMDMHVPRENLRDYLRQARAMDASVHVGQLFLIRDDLFSPFEPMTEADYRLLRDEL